MEYYWKNDKNFALSTPLDKEMMGQLPDEVQNQIYKNFLHGEFLIKFGSFFTIFKRGYKNLYYQKLNIRSLYTWSDTEYQNFMKMFLQSLEPRFLEEKEIILDEDDKCQEIIFIFKGDFDIGYTI